MFYNNKNYNDNSISMAHDAWKHLLIRTAIRCFHAEAAGMRFHPFNIHPSLLFSGKSAIAINIWCLFGIMSVWSCSTGRLLKGTVHPKMRIVSFTHPRVVPNLYECVCSEHKGRYCEGNSSSGAPLTPIVLFFLQWKSMVPQNCSVSFTISSFVFSRCIILY